MTDERLISKKDVLEAMGISYGQLYRWKRKGLIPESWFIRRSTFTGQETFFLRDKILDRIAQIKDMKDSHPLDNLADVITQQVNARVQVAVDRLQEMKWLDDTVLETCHIERDASKPLTLSETVCLGVLSRLRKAARTEELQLVQKTLEKRLNEALLDQISAESLRLYLLRKRVSGGGISAEVSLVILARDGAVFDPEIETIEVVDLKNVLDRIKLDLAKEVPEPQQGDRAKQRPTEEER